MSKSEVNTEIQHLYSKKSVNTLYTRFYQPLRQWAMQ